MSEYRGRERRRAERQRAMIPMILELPGREIRLTTGDISATGAFVPTRAELDFTGTLTADLVLPEAIDARVSIIATISRRVVEAGRHGAFPGYGLEFQRFRFEGSLRGIHQVMATWFEGEAPIAARSPARPTPSPRAPSKVPDERPAPAPRAGLRRPIPGGPSVTPQGPADQPPVAARSANLRHLLRQPGITEFELTPIDVDGNGRITTADDPATAEDAVRIDMPVVYRVGNISHIGHMRLLSRRACYVRTRHPLPERDRPVTIVLPRTNPQGRPIHLRILVARTDPGSEDRDPGFGGPIRAVDERGRVGAFRVLMRQLRRAVDEPDDA